MNGDRVAGTSRINMIAVPGWAELPWLVHGFSTRAGGFTTIYMSDRKAGDPAGELNLGFTPDDSPETVRANRELLLSHLPGAWGLVTARQTHSALIHRVDESHALGPGSPPLPVGDGLMTDVPGVLVGILTADCVPVLVVDRRRRAVAVFHAGWRGTVQQIVELGVLRMREEFGSAPEDLLAAVGPAIGGCCYTVGEEVRQQFASRFPYAGDLFSRPSSQTGAGNGQQNVTAATARLDLGEANRRQLLAAGLADSAVTVVGACTSCHPDRFFSHRAEHGVTGRMMAVVGVLAP